MPITPDTEPTPDTRLDCHTFGAQMKLLADDLAEMGMESTAGDLAKCALLIRLLASTGSSDAEVRACLDRDEDDALREVRQDAAIMRAVMP